LGESSFERTGTMEDAESRPWRPAPTHGPDRLTDPHRGRPHPHRSALKRFVFENGLTLVMMAFFVVSLAGMIVTGQHDYNDEQRQHGEPTVSVVEYLGTGHFGEAIFENWESEFLQMAAFVVLTAMLRQKGSPESKKLTGRQPVDEDPRHAQRRRDMPWPVRRGGLVLRLYEHSLGIALTMLFLLSFALHAVAGRPEFSAEREAHGEGAATLMDYLGSSTFWFESFQNWQSEFMSVGVLVILSIYLRERGSSQSKPVAAPHAETGEG
jgi:hypothetical protein